jgi:hypothetical protein
MKVEVVLTGDNSLGVADDGHIVVILEFSAVTS